VSAGCLGWLCSIIAVLLEPTHWTHNFSVEMESLSGRVGDVVR